MNATASNRRLPPNDAHRLPLARRLTLAVALAVFLATPRAGKADSEPPASVAASRAPSHGFFLAPAVLRGHTPTPPLPAQELPRKDPSPPTSPLALPQPAPAIQSQPADSQALILEDAFERRLSPHQRAALQGFAASLPLHRADPGQDGFLGQAGRILFPIPATVRLGKSTLHGGLVTVLKTGNPFGLLNPEVFGLSW